MSANLQKIHFENKIFLSIGNLSNFHLPRKIYTFPTKQSSNIKHLEISLNYLIPKSDCIYIQCKLRRIGLYRICFGPKLHLEHLLQKPQKYQKEKKLKKVIQIEKQNKAKLLYYPCKMSKLCKILHLGRLHTMCFFAWVFRFWGHFYCLPWL